MSGNDRYRRRLWRHARDSVRRKQFFCVDHDYERLLGLRLGGPGPAVYFSESDDGCEVTESEVVGTTGVGFFAAPYNIDAVVIRDREWVSEECDGSYLLVEDTQDWYAQDDAGNVWYLGEDTVAWDDEEDCLTDEGSWKSGDDDAEPGVVMLVDPRRARPTGRSTTRTKPKTWPSCCD